MYNILQIIILQIRRLANFEIPRIYNNIIHTAYIASYT